MNLGKARCCAVCKCAAGGLRLPGSQRPGGANDWLDKGFRKMGGYGSGRPALRGVIEDRIRLDVRGCARRGDLEPGSAGKLSWSCDGEETASAGYRAQDGALELHYTITSEDEERIPVAITIPVRLTPCRFGGYRSYWQCPRCGRRCEVVVMASHGRWWGCRRCMGLRHASQRQDRASRLQSRADELYARAGWESDDGSLVHKHKWMRWRTFNRLMDRANRVSREADVAALAGLARLGFLSWDEMYASVLGEPGTETMDV